VIPAKRSPAFRTTGNHLAERQILALEAIAERLTGLEAKLERVARAIERDANPSTHPL
jgi:hypothetical protein